MATTTAYRVTAVISADEATTETVTLTTEHPLSSYGQPVVVTDDGEAVPAQSYQHRLHAFFDVTDCGLLDRANELSGHYDAALDGRDALTLDVPDR